MSQLLILLVISFTFAIVNGGELSNEQILTMTQKFVELTKEACNLFGEDGFNFVDVASKVGKMAPILAGIAPAFTILQAFLPKDSSDEMKQIEKGFKEMHSRFDKVEEKLDKVMTTIEKVETYRDYMEIQDRIRHLADKQKQFLLDRTNERVIFEMQYACNDTLTAPEQALSDIHRETHDNRQRMDVRLMPVILKSSDYSLKKVQQIASIVIADAMQATLLRQTCLSVVKVDKDPIVQHSADKSAKLVKEIAMAFANLVQELKQNFHQEQLKTDVLAVVDSIKTRSNKTVVGEILKEFLEDKYDFLHWGVYLWKTMDALKFDRQLDSKKDSDHVGGQRTLRIPTEHGFNIGLVWVPKDKGALFWNRMFSKTNAETICGTTSANTQYSIQNVVTQFRQQAIRNDEAGMINIYDYSSDGSDFVRLGGQTEIFYQTCNGRYGTYHMVFLK